MVVSMFRCRQILLALVLIVGGPWSLQAGLAAQDPYARPNLSSATASPNDCSFLILGEYDPRPHLGDIHCGTLDVPENWSRPDGRRIRIGYAVLSSTSAQPQPDPILFLAGGPGTSPLSNLEAWSSVFNGLRGERDVIFFDQRGTRLSSPLRCEAHSVTLALDLPPEVIEAAGGQTPPPPSYPADLDAEAILQQAREQFAASAEACAGQIVETGVDLSQYNTISNANDAVALVKALGYEAYNLYGVSYGTRLALEIMRNHDDSGLRSIVLDSTYPPEVNSYEQFPQEPHEVVIQLFADCAVDTACHDAYPDLKSRFVALLAQLRVEPIVTDGGASITDRELIDVMQSLGANIVAVPYVPLMIAELERGEYETFLGITSGSLFATPDDSVAALASPSPLTAGAFSIARQFVIDLQATIASQPGHEPSQLTQLLIELDALEPNRDTLHAFILRLFPGSEHDETSARLLAEVDAMSDADVQEVFEVVEQTITLEDLRTVGVTVPQYYSIECNERIPFQSFGNMVSFAQQLEISELALGVPEEFAKVFAICESWPSGRAPESTGDPVWSDRPTLILAGAYDNLTPVSWNKSAFSTLPNGMFLLAPMSGHGVITYSTCAQQVAQAFVSNPGGQLDSSCFADLKPEWVLPAEQASSVSPVPVRAPNSA